jgi:hypothetical protein
MNMLSLHLYELFLVGVAVLLVKRFIWYAATLLVTIECAFILVPYARPCLVVVANLMPVKESRDGRCWRATGCRTTSIPF